MIELSKCCKITELPKFYEIIKLPRFGKKWSYFSNFVKLSNYRNSVRTIKLVTYCMIAELPKFSKDDEIGKILYDCRITEI